MPHATCTAQVLPLHAYGLIGVGAHELTGLVGNVK